MAQGVLLTISRNGIALKDSSIRSFQYRNLKNYIRNLYFIPSKTLELISDTIT